MIDYVHYIITLFLIQDICLRHFLRKQISQENPDLKACHKFKTYRIGKNAK